MADFSAHARDMNPSNSTYIFEIDNFIDFVIKKKT